MLKNGSEMREVRLDSNIQKMAQYAKGSIRPQFKQGAAGDSRRLPGCACIFPGNLFRSFRSKVATGKKRHPVKPHSDLLEKEPVVIMFGQTKRWMVYLLKFTVRKWMRAGQRAAGTVTQRDLTEDPLVKLMRVAMQTGRSEYDVFRESAQNWSVPDRRVQDDFNAYLNRHRLPFYVNDYVRKQLEQNIS